MSENLYTGREKEYKAEWYQKNKERLAPRYRLYRIINKEKMNLYKKRWANKNRNKVKESRKKFYGKNKERIKAWRYEYNQRNKEKIRNRNAEYRRKNRDKIKEKGKQYYKKNRIKIENYRRIYYQQNKEKIAKRMRDYKKIPKVHSHYNYLAREYVKKNQQAYIRKKVRTLILHGMKNYGNGKTCSSKTYGLDIEAIARQLKEKPDDIQKWHIDHIKPLSSFDLTDKEQVKQAFAPENHQWLTAKENLIKGNKREQEEGSI